MKTNFTLNPFITLSLLAGLMLAQTQSAFAIGKPFKKYTIANNNEPAEENAIKKEKARVKAFSSRNNSSVKIYPDIIKREMHVVAKENEGKNVDFFVFDLQGTLMQNYKLKAKDHFRITGLTKGTYVYRVFCGDEETASGKFEIR
ncbi:MAG TPA: T9SS type A sorting domain-containing protein [Chitinophagaceae bacterium]|nr:T9SS type A sorting domain-containing protein [Chitinophagaceae bacterium]